MAGFRINLRKIGFRIARNRILGGVVELQKKKKMAIRKAAMIANKELKKTLRKSGRNVNSPFKPLSPITIMLRKKKSKRPLLDTGALLRSINTTFSNDGNQAFIGVKRNAKSPTGNSLFNIATVHEFGSKPFVIKVTPAMRKFFIALSLISNGKIKPLSPSKRMIVHPGVPARPFVKPTLEFIAPNLKKQLGVSLRFSGSKDSII